MLGDVLYPLNRLKKIHPEIYERNLKRYAGRDHLRKAKIPQLNCLWNDVLHCSPIDLKILYRALLHAGIDPAPLEYFSIPLARIEAGAAVIYKFSAESPGIGEAPSESDFQSFDHAQFRAPERVPSAASDYYARSAKQKSGFPYLFHGIPHILVKQSMPVAGLEVLNWSDT